jgi:hypothetical protein
VSAKDLQWLPVRKACTAVMLRKRRLHRRHRQLRPHPSTRTRNRSADGGSA